MHINIILKLLTLIGILLNGLVSCAKGAESRSTVFDRNNSANDDYYEVALTGNAFLTTIPDGATENITDIGLVEWTSSESITSVYFRVENKGIVSLMLRAKAVSDVDESKIKVTVDDVSEEISVAGVEFVDYNVGNFAVNAGYVKVDLQGTSKTGEYYGDVSHLLVGGIERADIIFADIPEYYHWARKGPSCHMMYPIPTSENIEYYYGELTVPKGEDPVGSYFMSIGFLQGEFGIQVISEEERRILFSVRSPEISDNPSGTLNGLRVTLNRKGDGVITNDPDSEDDEVLGGQSFKIYNWSTDTTMKFLLKGEPDGAGSTDYTAWINTPSENEYSLIASWKRPRTQTYLIGYYSYLDNFLESNGYLERKVFLTNQWVYTDSGTWLPIQLAVFTVDNTYTLDQRIDAVGGVEGEDSKLYLQNGGFFNYRVAPDSNFDIPAAQETPDIDFDLLP